MADSKDLLIEIGTEELPPKALNTLSKAFTQGVVEGLEKAKIPFKKTYSFATPRRLAIRIDEVAVAQEDQISERKGPSLQAAYDANGNPTRAAEGFARSCGVTVEELEQKETDQGKWLVYSQEVKGKALKELLGEIITTALMKLPTPKRMRWGDSDVEFVRPVHWILILLGSDVVKGKIMGLDSSNHTQGHRFHSKGSIEISAVSEYEEKLGQGYVIADFDQRRQKIKKVAEDAASQLGGIAIIDKELLNEVTALVEWPVAVTGSFSQTFLDVPQECLMTTMQDNQKYFPVVDSKGKLLPHFITISNIESKDVSKVSEGNERVIRPRFGDAAFFWEQDRKRSLESRREDTKNIVFQQKLGSLYEKTERVKALAGYIAKQMGANTDQAQRAAELSKCDLLTEMVYEFPKLQGIMGRYYAQNDNEADAVATAIEEHYQPRYAGDKIPAQDIGQILALADKIDTLVGIFAIGQKPTGTKDPFALRRAALGILRILIEAGINLDLKALLQQASDGLQPKVETGHVVESTFEYINERLRAYYQDQNISADVIDSVASVQPGSPLDFDYRIKAVSHFRQLGEAESLAAANKRIRNILKKNQENVSSTVDPDLFQEQQEKALYDAMLAQKAKVEPLFQKGDYEAALVSLAELRKVVDDYFDEVMVMVDDEALRNNRLALLNQLREMFLNIADLSCLQ
jgi:glycyl-tRNA synthetase beta chain